MRDTRDFVEAIAPNLAEANHGLILAPVDVSDNEPRLNSEFHYDNIAPEQVSKPGDRCAVRLVIAVEPSNSLRGVGTSNYTNAAHQMKGASETSHSIKDSGPSWPWEQRRELLTSADDFTGETHEWRAMHWGTRRFIASDVNNYPWPTRPGSAYAGAIWRKGGPLDRKLVGIARTIQEELDEFASGVGSIRPETRVVKGAKEICKVAVEVASQPEITVDVDGELSFYLRVRSGNLIMAEMAVDGSIDVSIYDSKNRLLKRMPRATVQDFIEVIRF